jgi:hypothetical protein
MIDIFRRPGRSVALFSSALMSCTMFLHPAAAILAQTQAAASGATEPGPTFALTANLLQLMRGIFFPTSNMIFNVQTHDPADKKVAPQTGGGAGGFNWVQWGGGLYSGWEDVDYAAATLAEVTPLLLTPGRVCQNGKPVPVARADWVRYSTDMLQAARKAYEASRTRNRKAVSDSTNDLADACLACHTVYRDKRAPGAEAGSPANLALRCTTP